MPTWEATIPKFPFDQARVWKVAASAGCGKTFQLARAIEDLIFEKGVDKNKIMYLTFNKKPANEFIDKLRARGIDEPKWMGTNHAICYKLLGLRRENVLSGKALHDWGEAHGMRFKSDEDDEDTEWDAVMSSLSLKIYDGNPKLNPLEEKLLSRLEEEERTNKKYTFTRFLRKALVMRLFPPGVEYVFIDEAQDNSKIEYDHFRYLKSLEHIKGIMLVGDDKQAINRFKGGRWDLFMGFEADRYVCLGKTFRCADKILRFGNKIITPIQNRSPLTTESDKIQPGEVIFTRYLEDSIPEIVKDLKNKKSIFILSRVGSFLRSRIYGVLLRYNIPVQSATRDRVLKVFFGMRALAQKQNICKDDIMVFLPLSKPCTGDLKKTAYWERGGLDKFIKGDYPIDTDPDGHISYACLVLQETEQGLLSFKDLGFSNKFWSDVRGTLDNKIPRGVFAGINNNYLSDLERQIKTYGLDMGHVTVSTVHAIKGGEADTVILLRNITTGVENNEEDEERRVWYVGATRAKEKLIITEAYLRGGKTTYLI